MYLIHFSYIFHFYAYLYILLLNLFYSFNTIIRERGNGDMLRLSVHVHTLSNNTSLFTGIKDAYIVPEHTATLKGICT